MEPWKQDSILVRFEHILEKNEDPEWSKPARFNFDDVFRNLDIADIREVTLAANQWIEDAVRFKFRTDSEKKRERFISLATKNTRRFKEDLEVILEPMQIRTFIIELNPSV
jgi:lysosomal alpha-mannosidase